MSLMVAHPIGPYQGLFTMKMFVNSRMAICGWNTSFYSPWSYRKNITDAVLQKFEQRLFVNVFLRSVDQPSRKTSFQRTCDLRRA